MFCVNDDILTLFLQMRYVSNVGGVTVVLQQKDVFHVWQDVPDDRSVQVQDHT